MKFKAGTEDAEQAALVEWLILKKISFFHPRNGGYTGKIQGRKFKYLGVIPGIPDIFVCHPSTPYHGLFIELKRKGGIISAVQKSKIRELNQLGYFAIVAFGWESAAQITQNYLKAHHEVNFCSPVGKFIFK